MPVPELIKPGCNGEMPSLESLDTPETRMSLLLVLDLKQKPALFNKEQT